MSNKCSAQTMAKADKSIVIWGFGQEGQACYQYLKDHMLVDKIWILTDEFNPNINLLDKSYYLYGEAGLAKLSSGYFDLIVKSPGISLYRPELMTAQKNGSQLTSSTNLWFQRYPEAKTIIVTGTKGKSTTASLLGHLMANIGLDVLVAGNLGLPLISVEPANDWTILELSSYQLADLDAHSQVFLLLNLFQEHVPWHLSAEQYYLDKTKPAREGKTDLLVCNADSDLTKTYLLAPAQAQNNPLSPVYFNQINGFHINSGQLYFADEKLTIDFSLKGEHNLKNLAACLTILAELKLDWRQALSALSQFNPLDHRLEEHINAQGVIVVNDSISTTPDSTYCALKCYQTQPIYLILGGAEREQNYQVLIQQLAQFKIKHLALIGDVGLRLNKQLMAIDSTNKEQSLSFAYYSNLNQAMAFITKNVLASEVILLSPAAPSFGEFVDYKERGSRFLALADI